MALIDHATLPADTELAPAYEATTAST